MRLKMVLISFLLLGMFGLGISLQIWRSIPNIGPQMCYIECKRYNGNCILTKYDNINLICHLMEDKEEEEERIFDSPISKTSWFEDLPVTIQNLVEGCSNTICLSYYVCDVTSFTSTTFCTELDCPVGHHRALNDCIPCPRGYFQERTGQYNCDACPEGTHNPYLGSEICYACPKGSVQAHTGQITCDKCDLGKYQNKPGQTFCHPCNPGYYANRKGMHSCVPCSQGSVQPNFGNSGCNECEIGHYQDAPGQTHCKQCGSGTYQNERGQTYCKSCTDLNVIAATTCTVLTIICYIEIRMFLFLE